METGGFRCREKQITDLTIGGAKETRQKREDFGFIIMMLKIIRYHWVKEIDND